MKIIAFSDSHGRAGVLEDIVEKNPDIMHFFFLGDGVRDTETLPLLWPQKHFYTLSGNCDYFSDSPCEATVTVNGTRIFFCHGHTLNVRGGTAELVRRALLENASLVLYGHTHISNVDFHNGICLVNPGSVAASRVGKNSYAVIEIDKSGAKPTIVEL